MLKGHSHLELRRLHEKHGKAVRVGPNTVSLSDRDLLKVVYGGRGTKAWRKVGALPCDVWCIYHGMATIGPSIGPLYFPQHPSGQC